MTENQPNQKADPVIETEAVEIPTIQEEKTEPVIETEDLSETYTSEKKTEITTKVAFDKTFPINEKVQGEVKPESDRKLTHEKRILAYLESRHTGDFIKLNDFLKSLYPLPKPHEKPLWQNQGVMRKLRQDLMAMKDRGEIVFSNTNHERLGDNYHVGEERKRRDYNIGDLVIEAKLAF